MKRILLFAVSLIILSTLVSANTQISIYLDDSGSAQFLGESTDVINLPKGITIENGNIRGKTQELTSKQGDEWRFSYILENSEINVILPEYAEIINLEDGEISLRNSRLSVYVSGKIDLSYRINKSDQSNSSSILILAIVGLLVYAVWKINKTRQVKAHVKVDRIDSVLRVLNDREIRIIEELKKTGRVKSSQLRRLCEIPKASFSRHIHELERKKLLTLSGEGKNKFIDLA